MQRYFQSKYLGSNSADGLHFSAFHCTCSTLIITLLQIYHRTRCRVYARSCLHLSSFCRTVGARGPQLVVGIIISCISLSLPKVRNFAHFFSTFKHPVRHEMLKSFTYSSVACRHLLINYAPAVSEVVCRYLEVVVGALKKAHIFALRS